MDYLDFLYSRKGNVSWMYDVWNAFHCPEKGGKSLTTYFMDFKKVYEELNALMSFNPDVRIQQAQWEQMVVISFLSGLSSEFETAKYQILSGSNIGSLQEVFSRVLRTENVLSSQHTNVLAAKGGNVENARRVNNRGKNKALKIVAMIQNWNLRNQTANVATSDTATSSDSSNKIVTMTAEELAKYSQYQEALKASTPISALAESSKTCLVSASNKWIIDSGATNHMTSNHKTFSTFRTHYVPSITVVDGSTYEIKGSRTVKPTSSITLSSVLNLPNLAFNLISDLMTKRTFGKGHVSDGLYILDEWVPRPIVCVSIVSPVEAHCRSDNGKEYVSNSFQNYMSHNGILHQTSCVDTPSQNGVAERKNRHLLEMARALIFQMKVPKKFWADVVSIACFLINRMPTVVLKDTRTFVTKLDPKALKCVFLGYSRLQKGYRCFSTDLNKYLVSTDVVFSKDTSFFSSPISFASEEEDEEWLVYQVVNSRPTVGQSSVVDFDVSLAHLGTVVDVPPTLVKPPIVQVYSRHPVTTDTCPAPAPSSSDPSSDLDLPISLPKSKRHCKSTYSIANFVSYDHLSSSSSVLVASIDSILALKTITEALNHPSWKNAMLEEIRALEDNHTWKLVDLPQEKKVVGYKWVFVVKVNPDGSVARLKARLVARGYAQSYGLDIKNAFLHGDLEKEVYLEQPPGKEIQAFGMNKSKKDHFIFYKKSATGMILLVLYVDHIVITGNDHAGISDLKAFMHSKFHTKDLGELKYFLGIEVSRSKKRMFLSERKYVLDLLKETGKTEAKPCTTLMVPNVQLMPDDGDPFYNPERYRRVVGKLNYLTVTRPDITYAVSVVCQFTSAPTIKHWAALEQILCYLKKAPDLGILYSSQGHTRIECFFYADWASSKFDRRSTTESEYKAMAQATCEIIWIHQLLCEVGMKCTMSAKLWCDNQAALHIAANPVYHERTKHIEVDCHFIREKMRKI
ncbi:Retrovirus-related Pol polyprotein from transposon TNT 1-94 [Vitis vinifera]|uniref:Retrovirus-related Pol polyprotein from transposon TNT 1-94 n=1 Tax=Vitis vinifera TaxID=29760 RepID=A0A438IYN6_VITVI|nr:Retrovirus-related Pol polyprotein from transposon TNT 1-94 [Vitis vinifera]